MTSMIAAIQPRVVIQEIQNLVAAAPQVDLPLHHLFAGGVYVRSMFIPAGVFVVGKIHKTECINICLWGNISVLTAEGIKRFRAPEIVVSQAGIKKIGYAHVDTIWANIHATDETDLDKIEDMFIAQDYDDPDLLKFQREVLSWPGQR